MAGCLPVGQPGVYGHLQPSEAERNVGNFTIEEEDRRCVDAHVRSCATVLVHPLQVESMGHLTVETAHGSASMALSTQSTALIQGNAAHTKVLGNTIVQSTHALSSGVIALARCVSMEFNRTSATSLFSIQAGIHPRLKRSPLAFASPNCNKDQTMTTSDTDAIVVDAAPIARHTAEDASIRPFTVGMPQTAIDDLRRRIAATRWPDRETVTDQSQGVRLENLQALVRYWGTDYDWRKAEAKLNALPQFKTSVDGVDIHFIHVRSRHQNALPVIISHGWPGSVFEQIKLIGPLTDPTAFGGQAQDAFDVVIPSLPGYGFSAQPTEAGWGLERTGRAFDILMMRLGYTRYVSQGGDWGAGIVQAMGRQAPPGLLGIHTNLPAALPNDVGPALGGGPLPAGISEQERAVVDALKTFGQNGGLAYVAMMNARPQAVGYGLTDSPAGLAGWMLVHPGFEHWSFGKDPNQSPTRDDVLDNFTLYWLTNSAASSARIYWENRGRDLISAGAQKTDEISVPVAVTVFPDEVYRPPNTWAQRAFRNLIYFHEAERGGHFAAWEQPQLFAAEMRAAFKTLR